MEEACPCPKICMKTLLDKILEGRPITSEEYSQMGDLVQIGMQTVNSLCETLQITHGERKSF